MRKDKIKVQVFGLAKTWVIERDYKKFRETHLDMIGNGYNAEDCWLGVSEKVEVMKNEFRIITDGGYVISYALIGE